MLNICGVLVIKFVNVKAFTSGVILYNKQNIILPYPNTNLKRIGTINIKYNVWSKSDENCSRIRLLSEL